MYKVLFVILVFLYPLTSAKAEVSANFKAGAVVIGPADEGECVPAIEGALRWSSVDKTHHMCDGSSWKRIIASGGAGAPSMPPTDTGYFVLSAGAWNGDLGGLSGADAKCLTDLTDNDWLNKADAVSRGLLNGTKVKAFLCSSSTCQNVIAGAHYTFAASGAPSIGGASFTADISSRGPGNTQNWSGVNYFGTAAEYWTGRAAGAADLWSTTEDGNNRCYGNWSVGTSGYGGGYGVANAVNGARWQNGSAGCTAVKKIICLVHP